MDRAIKELTIGEHAFVVKTYATAREHQTIQSALLKDVKFDIVGEDPKLNQFAPSVIFDMHAEMVRQMVVSMDGTTENIVDRCLELPSDQFDDLVQELDRLVSKKKSST